MIQQRIPAARASLPLTAAWPTIKQDSQFVAASLFYQRAENILTSKPVLGAFAVLVLLWLACVAAKNCIQTPSNTLHNNNSPIRKRANLAFAQHDG